MFDLYTIGEVLIDFIAQESNLKVRDVKAFEKKCGGAPANVAFIYANLTKLNSNLVSVVGNDEFGHYIKNYLNKKGVNTKHLTSTNEANTALAFVSLDENNDRSFVFYRDVCADLTLHPKHINFEVEKNSMLHFCSLNLSTQNTIDAHIKLIEKIQNENGLISFDPNLRLNMWSDLNQLKTIVNKFIKYCDILKLSKEEIDIIFSNKITNIEDIFKLYPNVKVILVTDSSNPAKLYTKKLSVNYQSQNKYKVIDTTGAGDCFIGSFLAFLSQYNVSKDKLDEYFEVKENALNALKYASEIATYSTSIKGAMNDVYKYKENECV